jgi:lysophospholipase L1-like esterase
MLGFARSITRRASLAALAFGWLAAASMVAGAKESPANWAATWQASPEPARAPVVSLNNQTIRQVVRVSLGGNRFRVRLSNEYGDAPLRIGAAHLALAGDKGSILVGSDRTLTFSGAGETTIPPRTFVLSDPVELKVPSLGQLAISLYVPGNVKELTEHFFAMQEAWIAPRDVTGEATLAGAKVVTKRVILSGVDVVAPRRTKVMVALGDSTTGGFGSTLNGNQRWTDYLAERFVEKKQSVAVVNAGIGGNRLLHDFIGPNVLSRFDRDALSQSGVTHVVLLIGLNDFGLPGGRKLPQEEVTVEQVVAGFRQLIARAHARGVKVIGATLPPFGPLPERPGYYSEASAAKRNALNQWIREGKEFDAVIDFDLALRDPMDAKNMRTEFDSGDHMHPNDWGYKAMAWAINLKLFD